MKCWGGGGGGTCDGLTSHPEGALSNTPSCFMLQLTGVSYGSVGPLAHVKTSFFTLIMLVCCYL